MAAENKDPTVDNEALLAAVQLLASALEMSLQGLHVRNAVQCFEVAETVTAGTDYEFKLSDSP